MIFLFLFIALVIFYLDIFDSYSDAFSILLTFSFIWPTYLYLSIVLSDQAMINFSKLYVRVLSLCSPNALNSLKVQREIIKESIRVLVKKFAPEIFPTFKIKEHRGSKFELNDSINDAFGLLSEIGF